MHVAKVTDVNIIDRRVDRKVILFRLYVKNPYKFTHRIIVKEIKYHSHVDYQTFKEYEGRIDLRLHVEYGTTKKLHEYVKSLGYKLKETKREQPLKN